MVHDDKIVTADLTSFVSLKEFDKIWDGHDSSKLVRNCFFPLFYIQAVRIDFFFLLLKVANIRCFILIAVEIFHNIIRK
jgi:hypothetical protein